MPKTTLNKKVDYYFKAIAEISANEITVGHVREHLDINEINAFGNVAHAIINYEYDQEKALKTIELLFAMGLDPNFRAASTGYTIIHLALYGYTIDAGCDYPYSTEFIIKLIKLALASKKGFDVNLKDNEGDTIVHTALASDVYRGGTWEIIQALQPNFKIDAKDNEGRDIFEALEYYIACAESSKDDIWYKRLVATKAILHKNIGLPQSTKTILTTTVPTFKSLKSCSISSGELEDAQHLAAIDKEKQELAKELQSLIGKIPTIDSKTESPLEDIDKHLKTLWEVLIQVDSMKKRYTQLNARLKANKVDLESTYQELHTRLKIVLAILQKQITITPTRQRLSIFITLTKKCPFYEIDINIDELKSRFEAKLQNIERRVNDASTLTDIENVTTLIDNLLEADLKTKFQATLNEKSKKINEALEELLGIITSNADRSRRLNIPYDIEPYKKEILTLSEIQTLISKERDKANSLIAEATKKMCKEIQEIIDIYAEGVPPEIIKKIRDALPQDDAAKQEEKPQQPRRKGRKPTPVKKES